MTVINQESCVGCRICQTYCPVQAIEYDQGKCHVNPQLCTECYVCLRQHVCPQNAIEPMADDDYYRQFRHMMSDPVENHPVTGVTGRGTEEVKTNDVSGRVKRGEAGLCIDVGRPGVGAYLRDAEKIAMACVQAGLKLAAPQDTPLSGIMLDVSTGKLPEEALDQRVLSVIIEGKCREEQLPRILSALQQVEHQVDTAFCVGVILRVDKEGNTKALDCLDELGLPRPVRGKVNVGLGRPLAEA